MVKSLIAGFTDFKKDFFGNDKSFYENLAKRGQKPKTIIISCSDSRVDPAILFGARPGDLFVVRNVANLVPPYQPDENYHGISAAIEFGVRDLGVREIVVLGHAFCGGIKALCSHTFGDDKSDREFITSWIKIAMPIMNKFNIKSSEEYDVHQVEKDSIVNSMKNLRTFPWLRSLEVSNELIIHGWWFDMEHGALWAYNEDSNTFSKLVDN
ncbi:MAG: carbonic anhydrase [Paracoccaceae bacterium]|nr:carbonic anhydrase [Paracoccaceae bacterium]